MEHSITLLAFVAARPVHPDARVPRLQTFVDAEQRAVLVPRLLVRRDGQTRPYRAVDRGGACAGMSHTPPGTATRKTRKLRSDKRAF